MQTIKVNPSQTIYDIALIKYGSIQYAIDILQFNNLGLSDNIAGLTLNLPDITITSAEFTMKNKLPKTIASKYPI